MNRTTAFEKTICAHCGESCPDNTIFIGDDYFCCDGCRIVYELIKKNNLDYYYRLEKTPGKKIIEQHKNKYAYLDLPEIKNKLLDFTDTKISRVRLAIPQIHCSSCIWLLENLNRFERSIRLSTVDFPKKEISVVYDEANYSLRKLVELISSLGYQPEINFKNIDRSKDIPKRKSYAVKLAVSGFCFANIMLFSFPEYLAIESIISREFYLFFGYLNLLLSLPVFFYTASDYHMAAFRSLRRRMISIDVPISLGVAILFSRSLYEIISQTGAGYLDSMSGLIFFLLVGRLFQQKTYDSMSFDRDYKSYFPISVTKMENGNELYLPVTKIKENDIILIRNGELIPSDAVLLSGKANIDYSFVTGEKDPVSVEVGENIYAGGRQRGTSVELKVVKDVSHSYLTQLWNEIDKKATVDYRFQPVIDKVGKYFTLGILLIALTTGSVWYFIDPSQIVFAVSSVLIIACPCALALSAPFTFGAAQRILGRNKFYLKNSNLIEIMAKISDIVFDKTGTLTKTNSNRTNYTGVELSSYQKSVIKSLVRHSAHPLSLRLLEYLKSYDSLEVSSFDEKPGQGITGTVGGRSVMIGSRSFVDFREDATRHEEKSSVYVKIDDSYLGHFNFENDYRNGLSKLMSKLSHKFRISVLSGDNDNERDRLNEIIQGDAELRFNQSPLDKLNFIKEMQASDKRVLMFGDGLNDAGALQQSDIGVAVTEDINTFSPACDAIFDAGEFTKIDKFLTLSKKSVVIVLISFVISILYNVIGLIFAVQGLLSPLTAAILMPLSSITVVIFTTATVNLYARRIGL